jgi:hypothetical protein
MAGAFERGRLVMLSLIVNLAGKAGSLLPGTATPVFALVL